MKNNKSFLGLFLAALVLLPGCILHVPSYKCRSLKSVSNRCTYRGAEKNVIIRAKRLNRAEKNYLFDGRSLLFDGDELKVVYLSIYNLSDVAYLFSCDGINRKLVSYRDVVKSMKKTSSFGRLFLGAFGINSIVNASIQVSGPGCGILLIPLALPLAGFAVLGGIGLAQGIKSVVMNTRIKNDLEEKVLLNSVFIPSGEQYEGLMFLKASDYTPQFAVTLHEVDDVDNAITFDVDLRQTMYEKNYVRKIVTFDGDLYKNEQQEELIVE